ncbi:MAG: GntR family transcriptional regulator [Anaeroplasmataceae bacterium]|nr:GntR family transcriptional regulator [Anaeroplasmataceae bacterium]
MEWRHDKAIYLQVIELFKREIILGKYKLKDKIASVREYAVLLGVNPNTIVKVYDILTEEGLIEAQSTNGYYITDKEEILNQLKPEFAKTYCQEFLTQMKNIGYQKKEAIELLKKEEE